MPVQIESGYLETEAGPLYYSVTGEGHALTLVHAGVSDHRMWDDQVEEFAKRYRVVRYDSRGFGKSPVGDVDYSNRKDILDLLDHLGIDETYLMGVSRGGQIVVDFALEYPDRVDALIVVNGGVSGYESEPSDDLMKVFNEMEEAYTKGDYARVIDLDTQVWCAGPNRTVEQMDPAFVQRFRECNPLTNPLPEGSAKPVVLDPPAAGRLQEIKIPTLVIVGDQDVPSVLEAMDMLAQGVPGARKVLIEGTAHMSNMEKPAEFNRVVLDFLQSL